MAKLMGKMVKRLNTKIFIALILVVYGLAWEPFSPFLAFVQGIIVFLTLKSWEKPLALILFGQIPFFWFFNKFGVHGAGYYILLPIVFLLLVKNKNSFFGAFKAPSEIMRINMFIFCGIIVLSWSYGPKTQWATLKMFSIIGRVLLGSGAIFVFFKGIYGKSGRNARDSFFRIGLFGLVVCLLMFCSNAQIIPLKEFGIECWKKDLSMGAEAMVTGRLSGLALIIMLITFGEFPGKSFLKYILFSFSSIILFSPILIASGARQAYLGLLFGIAAWVFIEKRKTALLVLMYISLGLTLLVLKAEKEGNKRYILNNNQNIVKQTGRASKLEKGFQLWKKSPIFGVGLGGFRLGKGKEGRDYAHNLIVEILSETGIIGLIGIGGFLILLLFMWPKNNLNFYFVPIWVYLITISMFSMDLPENMGVFFVPIGLNWCLSNNYR